MSLRLHALQSKDGHIWTLKNLLRKKRVGTTRSVPRSLVSWILFFSAPVRKIHLRYLNWEFTVRRHGWKRRCLAEPGRMIPTVLMGRKEALEGKQTNYCSLRAFKTLFYTHQSRTFCSLLIDRRREEQWEFSIPRNTPLWRNTWQKLFSSDFASVS